MKEKFINIIKRGKWLGNTLLTLLLIAVVVAIVVAINVFVEKQNIPDIDLTKEKLYSLSEESKEKVRNVTQDTKIILYGMSSYPEVLDYAKLYNKENSHVEYEELEDATTRPDLQQKYGLGTSVTGGVVIIESGVRNKIISSNEFYTYDYTTGEQYNVTEQSLTNAILDVNLEQKPKIYFVTNHAQNADYYQVAKELLKNEANEVEDLDLLIEGKVPEDCNVLILTTLKEDLSEFERDIIISYINNGGNMLIMADPNTENIDLTNFQSILDLYGVSISNSIIYEQNTSNMINGYTNIIIPEVNGNSDITKYIASDGRVALLNAGVINYKTNEELEALGITSESLITATSTTTSGESKNVSGDNIAAVLTKKQSDDKTSKLELCANSLFVSDYSVGLNSASSSSKVLAINFYNNRDFIINSISYLTNRKDNVVIRKDTGVATYTATAKENSIIKTIITAIPVIIILTGIIVWQVRRRKK